MAHGAALAQGEDMARKSVAVIGDSTFFHSGLDGLASACYNQSDITVLVLDNGTTGMTGHQDNPSTGMTLAGQKVSPLSLIHILGVLKLLTAGGCGVWAIVDLFLVMNKTRELNFSKIIALL